jgi:outer membrane receptor for ferrienterochelin and colicins
MKTNTLSVKFCLVAASICLMANAAAQTQGENSPFSLDSLLQTRVTTASKYEQSLEEAPAAVSILTAHDIERYGFRTLAEAIATIRGFYLTYDRDYAYLGVRGFSRPSDYNNRIMLLLDGHPLNEDVFGSALLGTESGVMLASVERIEIVRGSLSSLYGTGALLASINVVTKRARVIDGIRASVEAGSYDSYQGSILFGKEGDQGLGLVGTAQWGRSAGQDLYFKEYDQPGNGNGIIKRGDEEDYRSISLSGHYSSFTIKGMFSDRDKHVPTAYYGTTFGDTRSFTTDRRAFLEAAYDGNVATGLQFTARTTFDAYMFSGEYPYADVLQHDRADGRWFGGNAGLKWDVTQDNRIALDLQFVHHDLSDYHYWDDQSFDLYFDAPFDQVSVTAGDVWDLSGKLSLSTGLRWDHYSFYGGVMAPRAALVFRPEPATTCKLMWGESFRIPNTYEREYYDPMGTFKRNGNLRPERITTSEIYVTHRFAANVLGTIAGYHYDLHDLVDLGYDPADSVQVYMNIEDVRSDGVEAELEIFLESGIRFFGRYMFQHSRLPSNETLSNSPAHIVRAGFFLPVWGGTGISFESSWESRRRTVQGDCTAPFVLANLGFMLQPFDGGPTALFTIRNVFNTPYAYPAGFEHVMSSIQQDGRSYSVRLSCGF